MLWVLFNKDGQVLYRTNVGNLPFAGTTDYQIYAVFQDVDISHYGSASIKFYKPDLDESSYYPLLMEKLPYGLEYDGAPSNTCPFENGQVYPGWLFDFTEYDGELSVQSLLDTAGLWRAVITLYNAIDSSMRDVVGSVVFEVGDGNESDDPEEIEIDNLLTVIYSQMGQYLLMKSPDYIKTVAHISDYDSDYFNTGDLIIDRTTKHIYQVNSDGEPVRIRVGVTIDEVLERNELFTIVDDISTMDLTNYDNGKIFYDRETKKFYVKVEEGYEAKNLNNEILSLNKENFDENNEYELSAEEAKILNVCNIIALKQMMPSGNSQTHYLIEGERYTRRRPLSTTTVYVELTNYMNVKDNQSFYVIRRVNGVLTLSVEKIGNYVETQIGANEGTFDEKELEILSRENSFILYKPDIVTHHLYKINEEIFGSVPIVVSGDSGDFLSINQLIIRVDFDTGEWELTEQTDDTVPTTSYLEENFQPTLTFDSTPTQNSTNPVTSSGVFNAVQDVREVAEGKCATYVIDNTQTSLSSSYFNGTNKVYTQDGDEITTWQDFLTYIGSIGGVYTCQNSQLTSSSDSIRFQLGSHETATSQMGGLQSYDGFYLLTTDKIVVRKMNKGDILLVIQLDVPDRWYANDETETTGTFLNRVTTTYSVFQKLETAKVDLSNYVDRTTNQNIGGEKTFVNDTKFSGKIYGPYNDYIELGGTNATSYVLSNVKLNKGLSLRCPASGSSGGGLDIIYESGLFPNYSGSFYNQDLKVSNKYTLRDTSNNYPTKFEFDVLNSSMKINLRNQNPSLEMYYDTQDGKTKVVGDFWQYQFNFKNGFFITNENNVSSVEPSYIKLWDDELYISPNTGTFLKNGSLLPAYDSENKNQDLGYSSAKWRDLYLKGKLSDGVNEVTVVNIANHIANTTSNPHNVNAAQVGLGSVVNTGDSATPTENGTTKFTTGGAYTLKTTLEGAIAALQGDVENVDNKLNVNVHVEGNSDEITYSGDTVTKTSPYKNLKTGATGSRSEVIHLANSTTAGMMSFTDYNQIRNNTSRIEALEGQTRRLLYSDKTNPTATEIQVFVNDRFFANGYHPQVAGTSTDTWAAGTWYSYDSGTDTYTLTTSEPANWSTNYADYFRFNPLNYVGLAVVVDGTYHIWHYYTNNVGWKDDGVDTVTQFSNSAPGIIQGKDADGFVYAENDGTGSVKGWSDLKNRVSNNESDISSLQSNKLDKITTATTYDQVYIKNADGTQGVVNLSNGVVNGSIVRRDANGQIAVQETPTADGHATSKKYVEDTISTALTNVAYKNINNNFSSKQTIADSSDSTVLYLSTSYSNNPNIEFTGTSGLKGSIGFNNTAATVWDAGGTGHPIALKNTDNRFTVKQTISNSNDTPLDINSTSSDADVYIGFYKSNTAKGWIGINDGKPYFVTNNASVKPSGEIALVSDIPTPMTAAEWKALMEE